MENVFIIIMIENIQNILMRVYTPDTVKKQGNALAVRNGASTAWAAKSAKDRRKEWESERRYEAAREVVAWVHLAAYASQKCARRPRQESHRRRAGRESAARRARA